MSLLIAGAGIAWAHGGATGIVKERMDAMTSLSKSVKKLTPIMRGRTDYNADTVQQEAEKIAKLGSSHLTELFPEGSLTGASEAKPAIWQQWSKFETYAQGLTRLADGLAAAAVNSTSRSAGVSAARGSTQTLSVEQLALMPPADVFRLVTKNCAGCHKAFRSKKN
ncbi:cytochrome c [Reinekea sp.]|jgi:cytochrome c556|uniref:c-type cytochrome n=1 Tax=Reinekea sp. TaxID=1970455 RepID=UPI002A82C587|nr:cytochrome c [Reinekea sp.]